LGGKLTGDRMKIYLGIDMAKDKFDYYAIDDAFDVLCRGSNKENKNERFKELSDLIRTLKSNSSKMKIGMESTGVYNILLYNHQSIWIQFAHFHSHHIYRQDTNNKEQSHKRALDLPFSGLSNTIDMDEDTLDMLSKYVTPEDFIPADPADIEKYVSKRRYDNIIKIASDSPVNLSTERSLRMEIYSLIIILKVLMD
jgi:hypothetical protein